MNFQTACRICIGENSEMTSIFGSHNFSEQNREIFKVITDCASVQIQKSDGFSELICASCLDCLSQAYSFKKLCEDSDYKFRNDLIVSYKIKLEDEDTIIDYCETKEDIRENADEEDRRTDLELSREKSEQCSQIKTDSLPDTNQNGKEDEEVDLTKPSIDVFEEPTNDNIRKRIENKTYKDHDGEEELDISRSSSSASEIMGCEEPYGLAQVQRNQNDTSGTIKPVYKCDICNKFSATKGHFFRHMKTHSEKQQHKCSVCNKQFRSTSILATHFRRHTGEKPYRCKFCDKGFSQHCNLMTHIRSHTGEKPYKCEICDKAFSGRGNLLRHVKYHKGEKPYKCDICDKAFSDRGYLMRHVKCHTEQKSNKCEICEKTFKYQCSLRRHMKKAHQRIRTV